jgi:hypothetical protein
MAGPGRSPSTRIRSRLADKSALRHHLRDGRNIEEPVDVDLFSADVAGVPGLAHQQCVQGLPGKPLQVGSQRRVVRQAPDAAFQPPSWYRSSAWTREVNRLVRTTSFSSPRPNVIDSLPIMKRFPARAPSSPTTMATIALLRFSNSAGWLTVTELPVPGNPSVSGLTGELPEGDGSPDISAQAGPGEGDPSVNSSQTLSPLKVVPGSGRAGAGM